MEILLNQRGPIKCQIKRDPTRSVYLVIIHTKRIEYFSVCLVITSLSKKMVELEKYIIFSIVYRHYSKSLFIVCLGIALLMVTAKKLKVFSTMKVIKIKLHNKMSDDWLTDLIV